MKTRSFSEKKIGFDDIFDVTKCLQQIGMADLLHVCAQWNEQPSNIKTMDFISILLKNFKYKVNEIMNLSQSDRFDFYERTADVNSPLNDNCFDGKIYPCRNK